MCKETFEEWFEDRVKYESVLSAFKAEKKRLSKKELNFIEENYIKLYDELDERYKPVPRLNEQELENAWLRCLSEKYSKEPYKHLLDVM